MSVHLLLKLLLYSLLALDWHIYQVYSKIKITITQMTIACVKSATLFFWTLDGTPHLHMSSPINRIIMMSKQAYSQWLSAKHIIKGAIASTWWRTFIITFGRCFFQCAFNLYIHLSLCYVFTGVRTNEFTNEFEP